MCHAVCLWNDMYIKLLIVKMSGEYLYFSLLASLNIKNNFIIYMSYALLNISSLLFILSLVVLYGWGLDSDVSRINVVKILKSLGYQLTNTGRCEWRDNLSEQTSLRYGDKLYKV